MAHRLSLVVGCICVFALTNSALAGGRGLALYSWKPAGKTWHFVLIPDEFPTRVTTTHVLKSAKPLVGIDAIKARLAATPHTGWAIMWRDLPRDHVLRYPRAAICADIITFGKQHGLNIERWPTLVE